MSRRGGRRSGCIWEKGGRCEVRRAGRCSRRIVRGRKGVPNQLFQRFVKEKKHGERGGEEKW